MLPMSKNSIDPLAPPLPPISKPTPKAFGGDATPQVYPDSEVGVAAAHPGEPSGRELVQNKTTPNHSDHTQSHITCPHIFPMADAATVPSHEGLPIQHGGPTHHSSSERAMISSSSPFESPLP